MAGLHYGFRALLLYKSGVQVSAALWTGLWSVPGWLQWESVTVCSATIRTLTCLLRWGSSTNSFSFLSDQVSVCSLLGSHLHHSPFLGLSISPDIKVRVPLLFDTICEIFKMLSNIYLHCCACGTSRNKSTQWGLVHSKWSQQTLKITGRILAVDGNGHPTINCFWGSGLHLHIIYT